MSEFTKGPWEHQLASKGCSELIYAPNAGDGNGGLITFIESGVSKSEDIANAHLIAAAPAMYEALEEILGKLTDCGHHKINFRPEDWIPGLNKALAKAKGE